MKYMQDGGFQNNPQMRLTLALTLALLVGFWATNAALYLTKMGLKPASVVAYYNGSEEDFRPPRSAESMLEVTHMHLPMMGMVLLLLTHLALFVPGSRGSKTALIVTAFVSALLQEGGGWLVRFLSPALAPVKIVGFLVLQGSILVLLARLGLFLLRAHRRPALAAGAQAGRARQEPGAPRVDSPLETLAGRQS